jgi:hypothetical protein
MDQPEIDRLAKVRSILLALVLLMLVIDLE